MAAPKKAKERRVEVRIVVDCRYRSASLNILLNERPVRNIYTFHKIQKDM